MGLMSNDLARLSPAAQKQVMEKMRKPGKYKRYWLPVVEDVKGIRTREYAMKAKMFRNRYGFAIREV